MKNVWKPPENMTIIKTIDAHTGGEPLRVITGGLQSIPGETILAKRRYAQQHLDHLRTGLMWEPRGHADMYGAIITEPVTSDGDFGVLFLHNEGFSTMCGHGVIALTKVVLDTGIIEKQGDYPIVKMDTPAGRVTATGHRTNDTITSVSFQNVPSFVYKHDLNIEVPGIGLVNYDIAFGGAFYAFCNAEDLGVGLDGKDHDQLIDLGKKMKKIVTSCQEITHPFEDELGFLYGTIFIDQPINPAHHSRNVCIFAEGEVDRSPTGTGLSARAAIHYSRGEIAPGESITIESILGTTMTVRVVSATSFGNYAAVIPEVTGSASITGQHEFYFDPGDPLKDGFILR